MDKLKLRQAIVVEGKYDQNTLRQIVDTAIFTTNGFADMKDPALLHLLQQAAQTTGLIILTDSDGRNHPSDHFPVFVEALLK